PATIFRSLQGQMSFNGFLQLPPFPACNRTRVSSSSAVEIKRFIPMAIETHVIFRGKLPSKAALQRAMKELGFPLSIKPATGSLEQQSGFMPMLLRRGEETGVEFDLFDRADMAEFEDVDPS